jgi:integrase
LTTIGTTVVEYLSFRQGSGRKPATLLKDGQCLTALLTFYGSETEVSAINLNDFFQNFVGSASYRNSHVSVFRGFFEYARKRGHCPLDFDPMYGFEHAPNPPKDKKYIPVELFPELLNATDDARDRFIVATGLYLFLRQGEISTLRVGDVHSDRIGVAIWKTNQFDRMQINYELSVEIARWLAVYRREAVVGPNTYLVPSTTYLWGKRTYNPAIPLERPYRAVQRALARLGWQDEEIEGEGGHLLRRSGARAMYFALLNQGSERAMAMVQRRLHHATRAMTERYIGITAIDSEMDETLIGKPMFPVAQDAKVIPIRHA